MPKSERVEGESEVCESSSFVLLDLTVPIHKQKRMKGETTQTNPQKVFSDLGQPEYGAVVPKACPKVQNCKMQKSECRMPICKLQNHSTQDSRVVPHRGTN